MTTRALKGRTAHVVKKHPFRVKKCNGWHGEKYCVYNENTNEVWRYFVSRRDAYEFAYYSNGNIGQYSTSLWY